MDGEITVKLAIEADMDQIIGLAKQLSESVVISEAYIASNFKTFLDNGQHCILVAVKDQSIVGYASGYFHHAIYAGGLVAYLDEIVVDASCRSRKIGSLLMVEFEKVSLEKGCRLVALATFGAKGFYEKLGYDTKAGYFKKYLESSRLH